MANNWMPAVWYTDSLQIGYLTTLIEPNKSGINIDRSKKAKNNKSLLKILQSQQGDREAVNSCMRNVHSQRYMRMWR